MTHDVGGQTASPLELVDVPLPSEVAPEISLAGPPLTPQQRIYLYSADEWEEFIREWVTGLGGSYVQIKRFGGAGDRGADVAAFKSSFGLQGPWDCFQGKHYAAPLSFSNGAPELLKVFRSVADSTYVMPDSYNFLAPRGCSTEFNKLLSQPTQLREKFLGKLAEIGPLTRDLDRSLVAQIRQVALEADFSRFKSVELIDAIKVHEKTPHHVRRFGTALRPRPVCAAPPDDLAEHETRYVE